MPPLSVKRPFRIYEMNKRDDYTKDYEASNSSKRTTYLEGRSQTVHTQISPFAISRFTSIPLPPENRFSGRCVDALDGLGSRILHRECALEPDVSGGVASTSPDCGVTDQPKDINPTIHKPIPGHV